MRIFSVIVSYNPNIENLTLLCQTLLNNDSNVIVVDNSEKNYISNHKNLADCLIIPLEVNTGIAYAQNIGIKHALKNKADIVIIFDQDSKINNKFIPSLIKHLTIGKPKVVVPLCYDEFDGKELPAIRLNKVGIPVKIYKDDNCNTPYDIDFSIASGTAATAITYDIVGLMDEDLFIDYVDIDWCLRLRSKNIALQVVPSATMIHSIGLRSINLWFMKCFVHSPIRTYYKIRNSFILLRKDYVPLLMALKEIITILIHQFALLFFVKNKTEYIKNYYVAVIHGVKGIVGEKPINR